MKKYLLGILSGVLLSASGVIFAETVNFSDVDVGDWYAESVWSLQDKGILSGYYEDGTYRPGNSVNRAEAAKMLNNEMDFLLAYDLANEIFLWSNLQPTPQMVTIDGKTIVESGPNAGGYSAPVLDADGVSALTDLLEGKDFVDILQCKEEFSEEISMVNRLYACEAVSENPDECADAYENLGTFSCEGIGDVEVEDTEWEMM